MGLLDETSLLERVLGHVERGTTDLSNEVWREPVEHYTSPERLEQEIARVFRRTAIVFCPSAALPEAGSYLARDPVGVPIIAVRGQDGVVRAFRNACRHRGAALAEGSGCKKVLVCPYHAWTYGLDGRLRGIPDEHGFPGVAKEDHGLVPVAAFERHGLVFINQDGEEGPDLPDEMDGAVPAGWGAVSQTERVVEANWKLVVEGFLEGYHIRHTHPETFFPRQYDNLNVIEHFGRSNRVTYPYRTVEKLKETPVERWDSRRAVTSVYHLFPNVMVSTHPATTGLSILEPLATDRTRYTTFMLAKRPETDEERKVLEKSKELISAAKAEDRFVVAANQKGLRSGANTHLTFGLFEGAIVHFHRALAEAIG